MQKRIYLERAADELEAKLRQHRVYVRVTGGTVGPRLIRFYMKPLSGTSVSQVTARADDIALTLRVPQVSIAQSPQGIELEFMNPKPKPVEWSTLWSQVGEVGEGMVLLGMKPDGVPLLARLASPEVAHILVAGTTGSGKSVLLREMALSLLLAHRPRTLGMVAVDLKGRTFPDGEFAPHLVRPVVTRPEDAPEVLRSLVRLMETRDARRAVIGKHGDARVVVFIDELAELVMVVEGATELLTRLVQRGRESGIHLVAATQRPSAAVISGLMKANFPLRLVGRVISPEDSRVAAGRGGANAHQLLGQGDFMAVGSQMTRFQASLVTLELFAKQVMMERRHTNERMVLTSAPQDNVQQDTQVVTDARVLAEKMRDVGHEWNSITDAAEWLFGKGKGGGGNFYRARLAVEYLNAHPEFLHGILHATTTARPILHLRATAA